MNNKQDNHYIKGLDGLRALAIFFIAAYHFGFGWAGGGFLGVDIFLVLAGYLTTSKILTLYEKEPDFNLWMFWSGRIRRLLPAAFTMITTAAVWVILFNRDLLSKLWGDVLTSLSYTINWWFIFHKLSYFDSFGAPSPLKHLWFLSVQEQFFFIFIIVLLMGLRYFKKREKFSIIVFILALCSSLLMGIMYSPDKDPSRVYYGTDTRSFELLVGSLLAIILPMDKLFFRKISNIKRYVLNFAGLTALAIFILSAVFVNEYKPFLYRGGLFLFSLNTAVLLLCICHTRSFLSNLLSWKPLRWIGTRSYGIYLWHYPVMVLSTPVYEIGNPVYWRVGMQLIITCIIAELSYRNIETPVRKLGFKGYYDRYLSFNILKWRQLNLLKKISAVTAVFVVVVFAKGIISTVKNTMMPEKTESFPTEVLVSITDEAVSDTSLSMMPSINTAANSAKKNAASSGEKNIKTTNNSYKKILAIGDSIMVDIAPYLEKKYVNITIDGKVARNMSATAKLVPSYAGFNNADNAVIIEVGTNGGITDIQIDFVLNTFSKAHTFLINTRVPRSWEKADNKILKEKADEWENVELIDWYSLAIKHPEYFGPDGVHLTPSGSEALTDLIVEALNFENRKMQ